MSQQFADSASLFNLTGRVAVITGGLGLLGRQHAAAIQAFGGIPVLLDRTTDPTLPNLAQNDAIVGAGPVSLQVDITNEASVRAAAELIMQRFGRIDILINNAANNPKMEARDDVEFSRYESFPLAQWEADLAVGLTGAFLCSQAFGTLMAQQQRGVILNIASDLAVIAPDQRIYRQDGLPEHRQPVKPVTYSVVKTALVGLTRYLATYWAEAGVRVNSLSPGGVYNSQPEDFVVRLSRLIPLGRMAHVDEYRGAIVFLCSDASSYMTGTNVVMDGGRSCW